MEFKESTGHFHEDSATEAKEHLEQSLKVEGMIRGSF